VGHIPLADTAYLKRRCGKGRSGDSFYVRVRVPADLRDVYGKKEIGRSLHTSDPKEAKRRKHAVVAEIFADFERARLGRLTSADIEDEAQRYLRERLEAIQTDPGDAFKDSDQGVLAEYVLTDHYEALREGDWFGYKEMAGAIARRYGTTLTHEQESELCRALLKADTEALARGLAIHNGQVPEPVSALNARSVDPITATPLPRTRIAPRQGKGPRVSEAASAYIAERNRQRRTAWTGQTLNQAQTTFRLFADFTSDAPIDTIKRSDVASFLTAIARLDPNYGRRITGKKLSLEALLKKFPAPDGEGLSRKTLKRHRGALAGLFDWAIQSGKLEGPNPARGHHHAGAKNDNDDGARRRAFTEDELNKLFGGPLFAGPRHQRVQPKDHSAKTALAWLIPISLFSGMRLDEICGLRTKDVCEDGSVLYFNLESHDGRRLKTSASRRKVPVHSELLRIGFADYLTHVKSKEHEYLLPALKGSGPDKKHGWYIGKRFTNYRRSVGISDPRAVFHSFRKNVATALERARIPENEAVQLLGHKKMTMSYGLYSAGLDLQGLARVVEAITYDGLELSHCTSRPD
jgi:integrase